VSSMSLRSYSESRAGCSAVGWREISPTSWLGDYLIESSAPRRRLEWNIPNLPVGGLSELAL